MTRRQPFFSFTDAEVREMLNCPGGVISDAMAASVGLERIQTQRERVLGLARQNLDVDWIFYEMRGAVPKSSIRSYLSVASARGEIGDGWRMRRRRTARCAR